jgi:hypothetical protein
MVLIHSGRKRTPRKTTFKQRKDLPGAVRESIPESTTFYRKKKQREALANAFADAGGVTVAELTPQSISQTLKLMYDGKMKYVDGVNSLLTDDHISQLKKSGEEALKGMLRNPGVVSAALAETGISIDKYETFVNTLLMGMKGVVASRQAQGFSTMALDELMTVVLPLTESPDGEFCGYLILVT